MPPEQMLARLGCAANALSISLPYCHRARRATAACTKSCAKHGLNRRCYDQNKMNAEKIGRVLGIGVRVAGRVAGERLAGTAGQNAPPNSARAIAAPKGSATKRLARGAGGFLRPFARVGGALWLEVTGVFFLLFALAFVRALWQLRADALHGPEHWKFLGSATVVALFAYLALSSFWRARRK